MPISGLVVTCDTSNGPIVDAVSILAAHPSVDVGEVSTHRIAIVVDTESKQQDQEIWQWIQGLPGVIDVNVAFVGFDDEGEVGVEVEVEVEVDEKHDHELVE
ncbi:chaperone NapD [Rubripirellula reticaptiva]|uniref:NapA signal peptide-binding chaperone NapD n=1 Tax=Rubripirellula reticaptiva TaxID=2528013 RepID=A0A5C6ED08_9BACT|nr:chaperone NapD [Rubripirellula reticaptiva]TWU46912.1 hypothetical protein Poly59_58860 [Rubripirellula reticaptiva]